jgi:hypothetical protein
MAQTLRSWLFQKGPAPLSDQLLKVLARGFMRNRNMSADRRAVLRRVCWLWRSIFELPTLPPAPPVYQCRMKPPHAFGQFAIPHDLARGIVIEGPSDELKRMRRLALEHPDPTVAQFINGCIDDTQSFWERAAVLGLYERCARNFERHLSVHQWAVLKMAGRGSLSGETPALVDVIDLPLRSFASMFWVLCAGTQDHEEARIPHNWHSNSTVVLYHTYERWYRREVIWFCRALLPCIAGVQMHLPRYPAIAKKLKEIRQMKLIDFIKLIEQEQLSEVYDRDTIYYKSTLRALLQDYGDMQLVPVSVEVYLHMWYIWKKLEFELYLQSKRRGDVSAIARRERFEAGNGKHTLTTAAQGSYFWWPRIPCISPPEDLFSGPEGTGLMLRGRPPL